VNEKGKAKVEVIDDDDDFGALGPEYLGYPEADTIFRVTGLWRGLWR
jgi:hypothetical protein